MSDALLKRKAWVVWQNTDLTEGRGREVVDRVCALESTARRLAHKNDVQGCDSRVTETEVFQKGYQWFGPIELIAPTREDEANEAALAAKRQRLEQKNAAIEKAKALGLSEQDIEALRGA